MRPDRRWYAKSRDGDWALLRFGGGEPGLLAHPANPEQDEGRVELNFAYGDSLTELEEGLREAGATIVRPTGDEGVGYQLQVADPSGLLITCRSQTRAGC